MVFSNLYNCTVTSVLNTQKRHLNKGSMRVDRTVEFRQLTDGIKVPVYKRSAIAPNDPQITPLIKKLNEEAKSIVLFL